MPFRNSDLITLARGIREDALEASKDIQRYFGMEVDSDLRLYDRLGFEDFAEMTKDFGEETTSRYVRTMEFRRLSRRV